MRGKYAATIGLLVALLLPVLVPLSAAADTASSPPKILISEVQTRPRSRDSPYSNERFVELYNPNGTPVNISNWKLEYKPSSGGTWTNRLASDQNQSTSYDIGPSEFYIIATTDFVAAHPDVHVDLLLNNDPLTSNEGGHLRLTADDDTLVDLVGWGQADSALTEPAAAPSYGQSLQRCTENNAMVDSGNNSNDFAVYDDSTANTAVSCPTPDPSPPPANMCPNLKLSEVGANLDDTHQFIEVYNTSSASLDISGCQLQSNRSSTRSYVFDNVVLAPLSYLAVYIKDTNLLLTKTTTGTVYALASDGQTEVDSVDYANLKPSTAWAWFGDGWRQTYRPTPGQANSWQEFAGCPTGQVRSSETGSCEGVSRTAVATTLVPCDERQSRNPATNRCRSIMAAVSDLVPCKDDQTRNPETNRCRSAASLAVADLKPCPAGQERNPLTNRCRKSGSGGQVAGATIAKDGSSEHALKTTHWLVAGFAVVGATSYGVYEWRQELLRLLGSLRNRLSGLRRK